jgi:hypothetical protein
MPKLCRKGQLLWPCSWQLPCTAQTHLEQMPSPARLPLPSRHTQHTTGWRYEQASPRDRLHDHVFDQQPTATAGCVRDDTSLVPCRTQHEWILSITSWITGHPTRTPNCSVPVSEQKLQGCSQPPPDMQQLPSLRHSHNVTSPGLINIQGHNSVMSRGQCLAHRLAVGAATTAPKHAAAKP